MLKHSFCEEEFKNFSSLSSDSDLYMMKNIADRFDCKKLPTVQDSCTSIGLPSVLNASHTCYEGTGLGKKKVRW
jgi:hypothetical protein